MFEKCKLLTLFTFAICYLGEDLVECLAKEVCNAKPINGTTSNNYFTLENVRKCMGYMLLHSRDLLNEAYGLESLSTKRAAGQLLLTNRLWFKIIETCANCKIVL